jgi:hypothetical protein
VLDQQDGYSLEILQKSLVRSKEQCHAFVSLDGTHACVSCPYMACYCTALFTSVSILRNQCCGEELQLVHAYCS